MNGWIKISRKLLEWEWYQDSNMVHLFIHLLLTASHKDFKCKGKTIKRGQLITGRDRLYAETNISVRTIRTCLERLKSTNEISIETTNQFSIITITKYDDYQTETFLTDQQNDDDVDQRLTNNRPTTDQQSTTIQEYKNKRSKINIVPPTLDELIKYFTDNGYRKDVAEKVFKYYDPHWTDSSGKKVKNWKQKMIGVWFREENKDLNHKEMKVEPHLSQSISDCPCR